MDWESGKFSIVTPEGEETVTGLVGDVFGIHDVDGRRAHWSVTHIPTGLRLTPGKGCRPERPVSLWVGEKVREMLFALNFMIARFR